MLLCEGPYMPLYTKPEIIRQLIYKISSLVIYRRMCPSPGSHFVRVNLYLEDRSLSCLIGPCGLHPLAVQLLKGVLCLWLSIILFFKGSLDHKLMTK